LVGWQWLGSFRVLRVFYQANKGIQAVPQATNLAYLSGQGGLIDGACGNASGGNGLAVGTVGPKPIQTNQYFELLTLFPDEAPETLEFLDFLNHQQTALQKLWP
jgi:hypothetical protein